MSTLLHDLRYAGRMLVKSPVFTLAAVLTLALGIGLNAAVFSGVEAILLRPLPGVRAPHELVQLYRQWPGLDYGSNSIPHYQDLRDRTDDIFSGVAAWTFAPGNLATDAGSEMVMGQMVSANFFSVLGVEPLRGRAFVPDEAVGPGEHPVIVLSHQAWQSRYGGAEDIVGRQVRLNGRQFTAVGVAPPEFKGPLPVVQVDFWVPLMMQPVMMPGRSWIHSRGTNSLSVLARLRPGVTVEQARAVLDGVLAGLREEYPDHYERSGILLVPQEEAGLHPTMRTAQVGMSGALMALVALLLLIACVNVANLFLARASERRKEMGIRLSLGARRGRLVRQLLTESLVFATVAGLLSLALAYAAIHVANGVRLPMDFTMDVDLRLSTPVLLFTLGATVFTGVVFGLAPALQASRPELVSSLKGETGTGPGAGSRTSRGLVVVQLALSLLLLVGAGLFVRSLGRAMTLDKGFDSDHLVLASMDPGLQGYELARTRDFYDEVLERVRALPGVRAAALADMVPLGFSSHQNGVAIPGYEPGHDEQMAIDFNVVTPGYFEAMGIPVLQGRPFTERDDEDGRPVLIVNERFAQRFWPGESAVGKTVRAWGEEREVVGVVPTGKYNRLSEEPLAFMYLPYAQGFRHTMTLHVRTAGEPAGMIPQLRRDIRALDPDVPLYDVRTMNNHLGIALLPARLGGVLLGIFGVLGLILAAIGIYGVMAYSVARRSREIGIRMALGAGRSEVVGMVLKQGGRLILIGTGLGIAGGLGVGTLVESLLYGVSAADPVTFVAVPAILVAVALLATYLPARRAAAVDPMAVIRAE